MTKALFENLVDLSATHNKGENITLEIALAGSTIASLRNIRVAYFYPFILEVRDNSWDLTKVARGRLVDIEVFRRNVFTIFS